MAHAGSVATISVPSGEESERFSVVRTRAQELTGNGTGGAPSVSEEAPARWFGGFSFREDHLPVGLWEGFPNARFLLPRVELDGWADGRVRLTVRSTLDGSPRPDDARASLEAEIESWRVRLAEPPGWPSSDWKGVSRRESPRGGWDRAVGEALEAIRDGRLSKAVLARTLEVSRPAPLDPVDVVNALWRDSRGSHVFLFEPSPGHAFLGAAPETLSTLRDGVFWATAVAGSTRRGATDDESRRLARELLESEKDRAEQQMVVEDMVARLGALTEGVTVQAEPHVLALSRIQHLETEIRAHLDPPRHVLELVEALHPTPAVCGLPRDDALSFLQEEEPFERGWYAGPVGWFDRDGEGVFAPALRSAITRGGEWRLFAGAGIVEGSEAQAEWEETHIKFEPVLRALEAVAGGEVGRPEEMGRPERPR